MILPSTSNQSSSIPPIPAPAPLPKLPKLKRGGQPGNQNARKAGHFSALQPGPLASTRLLVRLLHQRLQDPASPLDQIVEDARSAKKALPVPALETVDDIDAFVPIFGWYIQLQSIVSHAVSLSIPSIRRSAALSAIARDPFGWFERGYRACGISRDADSFFVDFENSAQYSPLPASHPRLATNLTDSQWSVLAPLIPPDPHLDWLTGEPPVIIAASRWGFTPYRYTSAASDKVVMEKYYKVLRRFPALCEPPDLANPPIGTNVHSHSATNGESNLPSPNVPFHLGRGRGWGRGRGRPRTSPRALLDAILWKLATANPWRALPPGFPHMRRCRKYYRRLFLSGRLYTLLLALYNHMRSTASTDLPGLLEAGIFTTTPAQKIALRPSTPATSENYTALLFMQLARSAYTDQHRHDKHARPINARFPDFKGASVLSTGELPAQVSTHAKVHSNGSERASQESPLPKSGLPPDMELGFPLPKCALSFEDRAATCSRRGSRSVAKGGPGGLPLNMGSLPPDMGVGTPRSKCVLSFGEGSGEGLEPLESSLAWKKWCKIEQDQKIIAEEVAKRLHPAVHPPSGNPDLSLLDE